MNVKSKDFPSLERDLLEWDIPEEVLSVLLKDRTTGRNLIWATEDYASRGKGFAAWRKSWLNEAGICRNSAHHERVACDGCEIIYGGIENEKRRWRETE